MAPVKTYTARARRWERGWELHIPGVGVTQSHGLADADEMIADYIRIITGAEPGDYEISLTIEVGDDLDDLVRQTRRNLEAAAEAQRAAAEGSRELVRRLKDKGLTGRDIAAVLGVSPQRVSQLTTA